MNPVNKHTVLKEVREKGTWEGYIAPNMVRVPSVWHIESSIKIVREGLGYYVERNDERVELESYLNSYKYYNCIAELGKTVRFWK